MVCSGVLKSATYPFFFGFQISNNFGMVA